MGFKDYGVSNIPTNKATNLQTNRPVSCEMCKMEINMYKEFSKAFYRIFNKGKTVCSILHVLGGFE